MELNTLRESFEHVVKKRKLSSAKCHEVVDKINHELEHALSTVKSEQDPKSILSDLKSKLNEFKPENELESSQKELNVNLSKHQKFLEKVTDTDLSKGYRKIEFDVHTMNQIITDHFFCQGLFGIGDCLIEETSTRTTPEGNVFRSQLYEMYKIIESLRAENIQPALNWISDNDEKLKEDGVSFKLKLHQVQFVELLKHGTRTEALNYARANLAPLASSHMYEVQKLMASLLWVGKLEKCPHFQLLTPINWVDLVNELTRLFLMLFGRSCRDPLDLTVQAGYEALPTILKLMNVVGLKIRDQETAEELPLLVDLGKGFQFHSSFVCPVSREQGSVENPPMLLPCGHVLCRQSIVQISKNNNRGFKCPYCPISTQVAQCRQLYL